MTSSFVSNMARRTRQNGGFGYSFGNLARAGEGFTDILGRTG